MVGRLRKGSCFVTDHGANLHHACLGFQTEGACVAAFDAIPCWRAERIGDNVFVRGKLSRFIQTRR